MGDSFTLNTRIAFGHGCDLSNYVRHKIMFRGTIVNMLTYNAVYPRISALELLMQGS